MPQMPSPGVGSNVVDTRLIGSTESLRGQHTYKNSIKHVLMVVHVTLNLPMDH